MTQSFQNTADGFRGNFSIVRYIGILILKFIDTNTLFNITKPFPQIVFPKHTRRQFRY